MSVAVGMIGNMTIDIGVALIARAAVVAAASTFLLIGSPPDNLGRREWRAADLVASPERRYAPETALGPCGEPWRPLPPGVIIVPPAPVPGIAGGQHVAPDLDVPAPPMTKMTPTAGGWDCTYPPAQENLRRPPEDAGTVPRPDTGVAKPVDNTKSME